MAAIAVYVTVLVYGSKSENYNSTWFLLVFYKISSIYFLLFPFSFVILLGCTMLLCNVDNANRAR